MAINEKQWQNNGIDPVGECIDSCLSDLQDSANDSFQRGISTGYECLDRVTGGIAPKSFNVIAGRPCMGTTTLALRIGLNIATDQKRSVVIFSLTKDKHIIASRLLSIKSGVGWERRNRTNLNNGDFSKIEVAAEKIKSSPLFIEDELLSIHEIECKIKNYIACDLKPALVIIDDLTEFASIHHIKNVRKIVKQIRQLIQETDVPVILTTLLPRKIEKRKFKHPLLRDVPEGLMHPSPDLLILLYREDYYNPNPLSAAKSTDICVGLNRYGSVGSVRLGDFEAREDEGTGEMLSWASSNSENRCQGEHDHQI